MLETATGPAKVFKAVEWKSFEGEAIKPNIRLRQCLGSSETTAVFVADYSGKPSVAVKLIAADVAQADAQLSRWSAVSRLAHPHLIKIFEFGRCRLGANEVIFAVMEYGEENLAQVLPLRALTPAETREVLVPLVDVLSYLHAQGYVHGRVKPSNILAVHDILKLSSDGLWGKNDRQPVSRSSSAYDAPEAAANSGPGADVWSLGVVLVEALTQQAPFSGGMKSELMFAEGLSSPFREIARECLNPDPSRRCTVADIFWRLNLPQGDAQKLETHKPEQRQSQIRQPELASKRDAVSRKTSGPAVAAGLALILAMAGGLWLYHIRGSSGSRTGDASPVQVAQPAPIAPQPSTSAEPSGPPKAEKPINAANNPNANDAILRAVEPNVSRGALRTIHGTIKVRVKVRVDSKGAVTDAGFVTRGSSQYFAREALAAAREWKFATASDQSGSRQWILLFEFRKSGAKVVPSQAAP